MTCPLCRAEFDKNFVPAVDIKIQSEVKLNFNSAFEQRKAELIQQGLWRGNRLPFRFAFGNTHSLVIDPKPANSDQKKKNSHRWVMFVCLNNDKDATQKYIKSVTYHLHPTFKPSVIKVEEAPFLLSRVGWGYFDVEVIVEFQPNTNIGVKKIVHELCFDG